MVNNLNVVPDVDDIACKKANADITKERPSATYIPTKIDAGHGGSTNAQDNLSFDVPMSLMSSAACRKSKCDFVEQRAPRNPKTLVCHPPASESRHVKIQKHVDSLISDGYIGTASQPSMRRRQTVVLPKSENVHRETSIQIDKKLLSKNMFIGKGGLSQQHHEKQRMDKELNAALKANLEFVSGNEKLQ